MRQTVVGIFDSESEAQNAVQKLLNDGFRNENIDVSGNTGSYQNQSNEFRGNDYQNNSDNDDFGDKIGRFFNNLFGDDNDEAKNYTSVAQKGCVVTVHADSEEEAERAVDILDLYGAVDVDEKASGFGSNVSDNSFSSDSSYNKRSSNMEDNAFNTDYNSTERMSEDTSLGGFNSDESSSRDHSFRNESFRTEDLGEGVEENLSDRQNSIPIVEEQMNIGKREVEKGGVRVRSRIIERPVEETLRLRVERVNVERNPVNRPASEADLNSFKEGTIEVSQREEVPVVNKEARVVEEVSVGKNVEERTETIRDSVRKTEVDVENFGADRDRFSNRENITDRDRLGDRDILNDRDRLRDDV